MIRRFVAFIAFTFGLLAGGLIAARTGVTITPARISEAQILAVVRNHGDVIIEALQDEHAKRRQQAEAQTQIALRAHEAEFLEAGSDTPVMGNLNGRHILVYFFDATCHFCREFDPHLKAMLVNDPDLKLILRPLAILGPHLPDGGLRPDAPSAIAALYTDAIWHRSRAIFAKFLEALMSRPIQDAEALAALARSFGLDPGDMAHYPGSGTRIADNAALFRLAGGQGTPFLLVKGPGSLQAFSGAVAPKMIEAAFSEIH